MDPEHPSLSVRRQCELLDLDRSTFYYQPCTETRVNLELMRAIDELYLKRPYFGSRRIAEELDVNRKRVQRLMRLMGLEAIYPKPRPHARRRAQDLPVFTAEYGDYAPRPGVEHRHHVHPAARGFLYLTAVIDWYSRYVLAWRLSRSLEGMFCCERWRRRW